MFSPNQFAESEHQESFLLPDGVLFYGDIESANPGRIDGNVSGNISVDSKLFIGETACVNGNISAVHIIIQGRVEGDIDCKNKVVICNSAIINGNILAKTIDIKEGSVINGSVIKRGEQTADQKFILRDISANISPKKVSYKTVISSGKDKVIVTDDLLSVEGWF